MIGQYAPSSAPLNGFIFTSSEKNFGISCVLIKKRAYYITNFVKVMINWQQNFAIILVIKQIGLPRILLITRMTTDRIGLYSDLLPLLILLLAHG